MTGEDRDTDTAAATAPPPPPLRRFTFRNFSGVHEVEAAHVEFTPTHVVFRGPAGEIVLAEPADKIQRLREDTGGDDA